MSWWRDWGVGLYNNTTATWPPFSLEVLCPLWVLSHHIPCRDWTVVDSTHLKNSTPFKNVAHSFDFSCHSKHPFSRETGSKWAETASPQPPTPSSEVSVGTVAPAWSSSSWHLHCQTPPPRRGPQRPGMKFSESGHQWIWIWSFMRPMFESPDNTHSRIWKECLLCKAFVRGLSFWYLKHTNQRFPTSLLNSDKLTEQQKSINFQ